MKDEDIAFCARPERLITHVIAKTIDIQNTGESMRTLYAQRANSENAERVYPRIKWFIHKNGIDAINFSKIPKLNTTHKTKSFNSKIFL